MDKDKTTTEGEDLGRGELPGGPKYMSKADDVRPKPKRFYKEVSVKTEGGLFQVCLDERIIKTPMKSTLAVGSAALAEAIAEEWSSQGEEIDSEAMIFTKLANTAIDRVATRRDDILSELVSYGGNDLLCYRASEPASLVAKETEVWDPFLNWFKETYDIRLALAAGVIHVAQEAAELDKLSSLYEKQDEFALTALHNMTTMTGSALLPLALLLGDWGPDAIWKAAHVEEDFQIERWGEDEEAQKRRKKRHEEFLLTHRFYELASRA